MELIDLLPYYNNCGITCLEKNKIGNFTGLGSSYPRDQLPSTPTVKVFDIPFLFPLDDQEFDNIEFNKQKIVIPSHAYTELYFLGASENGSFEESISLIKDNKLIKKVNLGLSNWISENSEFNEKKGYGCNYLCKAEVKLHSVSTNIWFQSIKLGPPTSFDTIHLTDNPSMHVFSLTLL